MKLNLILCASAHLPSGAGETMFEELYHREIRPLVSALDKFPRINMIFHYSGVVLYWLERRRPEFFMLLEDLIARKQAEFLGGGFYNPVLPLLPPADRIGQIDMLTTYLRKHFGRRPQGCWLPSMSWEQSLVGPLNSCGMSYTFLEDGQFAGAGVEPGANGIYPACLTEDQGKLLTVFPVAAAMGRELRKGKPGKIMGELLAGAAWSCNQVLVLPVTGEAGTEYEQFFGELSALPDIEPTSPSRIIKSLKGLKKAYFPACVPQKQGNKTCPRQFLAEHPEAGGIYAKTIYVHSLINNQLRGDKTRKRTALEELWKAQDSGLFRLGSAASPGLLHAPVRKAAYSSLLESEKITREKGKFTPSLSVFDFDLDGEGEYLFQDDKLGCCVKLRGAGIFELDYLPAAWNYLDTLGGSDKRCSFVDWLAPAETQPADAGPEGIKGGRFCGGEVYEASETDRVRRRVSFRLPPQEGLPWGEIEIEKTWQLKKNSMSLEYVLKNTGTAQLSFVFCPALDLSFAGEGEENFRILSVREGEKESVTFDGDSTLSNIRALEFQDIKNETLITLEASRGFNGRIFNIRPESGGPAEYQSTCVMPLLPVSLEGGKSWKMSLSLRISS